MLDFSNLRLVYIVILGATVGIQAGISYWVYRTKRDQSGAIWFIIMASTGIVWVLPLMILLVIQDVTLQRVAILTGHWGAMLTVSAFAIFVSKYTEGGFHRDLHMQLSIAVVVIGYLVLAVTNHRHFLLFANFEQVTEPFQYLAADRQIGFFALLAVLHWIGGFATYRMVIYLLSTQQRSALQLMMFVIGAVSIIIIDNVDTFTPLLPADGFTESALGMFIFYSFTAMALFRFDLLDIKPVARNSVMENLQDPVIVIDDTQQIVDYNRAAQDIFPHIDQHVQTRVGEVAPKIGTEVSDQLNGETTAEITLDVDGNQRYYSVTISPVTAQGTQTGWYSIVLRDITKLEESRDQLKQQNERLNKVASTISHDLRNPINVAMGHVGMLETKLEDDDLLEHVDRTSETHDRMLEIIQDILTIAREGETVEETESVDLESLAREAWKNVDNKAARLTVVDTFEFHADRSKVKTIFENLFRNSLDHGPHDVTLEVGTVQSGFYIQDNGPGIPEEKVDSIFEFGYTTEQDGTGLGLAIVKTMAESHGWTVRIDTAYDDGARFVIEDMDGYISGADTGEEDTEVVS